MQSSLDCATDGGGAPSENRASMHEIAAYVKRDSLTGAIFWLHPFGHKNSTFFFKNQPALVLFWEHSSRRSTSMIGVGHRLGMRKRNSLQVISLQAVEEAYMTGSASGYFAGAGVCAFSCN
jgi:hypothetical protein